MDIKRVITEFLGLQDINIEDIKQYKKDRRCTIQIRHLKHKVSCHYCETALESVREWHLKELKGPPIGVYTDVTIKFYQARGHCPTCNSKRMASAPFIHPDHTSMTCSFAEVAGRLMEELSCEATARLLQADSMTLWRLDQTRMNYMMTYLELPDDVQLTHLCADEVHFKTKRIVKEKRRSLFSKRYEMEWITNLVSWKDSKVLFNSVGRDKKALKGCLDVLTPEQKNAVQYFAVDVHDPFMSAVREECKNAKLCVDRFHLAKLLNERFDDVRKGEFKASKKALKAVGKTTDFETTMLLPHRRFILVSKEKGLSNPEEKLLKKLRKLNQNIHNAMLIVEYFHAVLDKKKVSSFRKSLVHWYRLVRESKLKPFKKFAKTIRRYRKYIEGYIESGLTTGVSEGLNNKIKALKRAGYGYQSAMSFRMKILQRCGYLNSRWVDTSSFYYSMTMPTT